MNTAKTVATSMDSAMSERAMGSHQSAFTGSDVWLTPRYVLDALGPFDLDPCAAPDPKLWPTAQHHIAFPRDGLSEPWHGRVWLNPPYATVWRWLAKLADHNDGVALIFARTETSGFVNQVWERATAILFLHGRLVFHSTNGRLGKGNSGAPSCLVAYGENNAARLTEVIGSGALKGSLVSDWRTSETVQSIQLELPTADGSAR